MKQREVEDKGKELEAKVNLLKVQADDAQAEGAAGRGDQAGAPGPLAFTEQSAGYFDLSTPGEVPTGEARSP